MGNVVNYTQDDHIFVDLDNEDIWVNEIFNYIKLNSRNQNIYYFQLVTRTTNAGKSEYIDFLGYGGNDYNRLLHINKLISHLRTYGSIACSHIYGGLKQNTFNVEKLDNIEENHILEPLDGKQQIKKINHTKFNYLEAANSNSEKDSSKDYFQNCLNIKECSREKGSKYYLHYVAVSIGRDTAYLNSKSSYININSPEYYGFGSSLFFVTKDKNFPILLPYNLSYILNKRLLVETISIIKKSNKQKEDALKSNQLIITEMKEITKHINTARIISNRVQAKLDNFGEIFSNWYQESMQKIFTDNNIFLGNFFIFNQDGEKTKTKENIFSQHSIVGNHQDYQNYLKRIITTTEGYFSTQSNNEYLFIKILMKRYKNSKENYINIIKKIKEKEGYRYIDLYFPIGLMLFFFKSNYTENYFKDAVLDIENTDISHIAILNGLNKLFTFNEFKKEQVIVNCNKNYLDIKIILNNHGSENLFNTLIDFHNHEPHPNRKTTTFMIRQLMGISENNYNKELFAIHRNNEYKVGLTISGDYLIKAFVEKNTFNLRYVLKKRKIYKA